MRDSHAARGLGEGCLRAEVRTGVRSVLKNLWHDRSWAPDRWVCVVSPLMAPKSREGGSGCLLGERGQLEMNAVHCPGCLPEGLALKGGNLVLAFPSGMITLTC